MARRNAAHQLTDRDRAILCWIGQAGIATVDQVARFAWPGRSMETARDRLRRLVKAGYLQQTTCDARQPGEPVYTLTRAGWLMFPRQERERLRIGLPLPYERMQQLLSQEAYLRLAAEAQFAGGTLVAWRSERELRGDLREPGHTPAPIGQHPPLEEIPDGQAVITNADGTIMTFDVEIDGQYYGRMLLQKAQHYGQGGHPTIWVCTAKRAPIVQRATRAYPNIRVLVV
jgi:hypothetical protein